MCPSRLAWHEILKASIAALPPASATNVPGLQDPYEPPEAPEVVIHGENPEFDAERIIQKLVEKGYVK